MIADVAERRPPDDAEGKALRPEAVRPRPVADAVDTIRPALAVAGMLAAGGTPLPLIAMPAIASALRHLWGRAG